MKQESLFPATMIAVGGVSNKDKRKKLLFRVQADQRNRPRIIEAYAYQHAKHIANKMRGYKHTEERGLVITKIDSI